MIFFQFTLFLLIGILLFVYYRDTGLAAPRPRPTASTRSSSGTTCRRASPGLVIAAILAAAMSNLSAALNSLASTTIMDFYRRCAPQAQTRPTTCDWRAMATVAWGVVLLAIGILARQWGSVLEAGLTIASILYGALLGVFLLGRADAARRASARPWRAWWPAWPSSATCDSFTPIAWTWYVLIGDHRDLRRRVPGVAVSRRARREDA